MDTSALSRLPKPKQGTLSALTLLSFIKQAEFVNELKRYEPDDAFDSVSVLRPGKGRRLIRTDAQDQNDRITYESYDPPSLWGPSYSIVQAHFAPGEGEGFMFHRGEEIIAPTSGSINYRFYHARGRRFGNNGEVALPEQYTLDEQVRVGSILRVNSQLPHETYAVHPEGATAWMILRDAGVTPASIGFEPFITNTASVINAPRRVSEEELQDFAIYALTAWGLSDAIQLYRENARLSIAQLAALCGVDPGQISRLENRHSSANISFNVIVRIAEVLRLPLNDLIKESEWNYKAGDLEACSRQMCPVLPRVGTFPHYLHPHHLRLAVGESFNLKPVMTEGYRASWIALGGQATLTVETLGSEGRTEKRYEILVEGSVLHLRNARVVSVAALEASSLLQVRYCEPCSCHDD